MSNRKRKNNIKYSVSIILIALFLFATMIGRLCQLALSDEIDGKNLKQLKSNRTTRTTKIQAKRGTIYSSDNDILVQTVTSYKLIAYLDPKRTINKNNPQHVIDKEKTAEELSKIINMSKEDILYRLNKDAEGLKQTEFGTAGKGLTEITKKKIDNLNLPGLDFEESFKRYYPKGDFASYTIGYAKTDDTGKISGEMGIEKYYDELLSGEDGYRKYQKDLRGYQISSSL